MRLYMNASRLSKEAKSCVDLLDLPAKVHLQLFTFGMDNETVVRRQHVTRDIQRVDHLCVPFGLSDKCVEFHSCLHHNYVFYTRTKPAR
jgi:hypothetical protein